MKITVIIIISFLACIHLQAQNKNWQFQSVNTFSHLFGNKKNGYNIHTVNGVLYQQKYGVALGAGYEQYHYNGSIPLFLQLKRQFNFRNNQHLNVFANNGTSFITKTPFKNTNFSGVKKYPSYYGNYGISYWLPLEKNCFLTIGISYNLHRFKLKETFQWEVIDGQKYSEYIFQKFRTIGLTAGLVF
ncbi:hypothetical protein [Polluticaenibacter yanchengensis]|uniref:Outer membrane protein beta-barrel domain-containing protein n=1 Tax=Polluticaenibacter yanchengensis TaxID=3014562 RepID=A0ABT4UFD9_9BACT|nr:hypothetical protein [Chitinophagaceae bacterium LY-5]